ncbi:MAG: imidazole glycerol phosphate synthase subunit HisH [Gemmatimonadales bacterium]
MRITLFDYGAGNLHSLAKAIDRCGTSPSIVTDPVRAVDTDVLVLPGVGAFEPAAARLAPGRSAIREALRAGLPCLGICLGMQLLFDGSDEGGGDGIGAIAGRVTKLQAASIPQIGWNTVEEATDPVLLRSGIATAYYANSYVCRPADPAVVVAWSRHEGDRYPAAVRHGASLGVQFHPEKSSSPGLALIDAFLAAARR